MNNFIESAYTFINEAQRHLKKRLPESIKNFSYIPLTQITERVATITSALILGGEISFPEDLEKTFYRDIKKTQPNTFFAPPRIWAKFQEIILKKVPQKKLDIILKTPGVSTYMKNKIKKRLGINKTLFVTSGGAKLDVNIIDWFLSIDIEIFQAYGTTEDCYVTHSNLPGANKKGTVGKLLPNMDSKLSKKGEILVKSNSLMKGYFKDPERTKKAFTDDGFFKTGDIGEYDSEGYLTIVGRLKNIFKTDKGKYISPEYIEAKLSENINIEYTCVVGVGLPQPIALVTLSPTGKRKVQQQVIESMIKTTYIINNTLENQEKIEKVIILKEDWNEDLNFTTTTMKLKRDNIEKKISPFYKSWYESEDKVIYEA